MLLDNSSLISQSSVIDEMSDELVVEKQPALCYSLL